MSNSERVVLVLGGAGTVGSGIVKGLLDKGRWTWGHISCETTLRIFLIYLFFNPLLFSDMNRIVLKKNLCCEVITVQKKKIVCILAAYFLVNASVSHEYCVDAQLVFHAPVKAMNSRISCSVASDARLFRACRELAECTVQVMVHSESTSFVSMRSSVSVKRSMSMSSSS